MTPTDQFSADVTLRFPRVAKIRYDKNWWECETLQTVQALGRSQMTLNHAVKVHLFDGATPCCVGFRITWQFGLDLCLGTGSRHICGATREAEAKTSSSRKENIERLAARLDRCYTCELVIRAL